jgi:hypothetical protein
VLVDLALDPPALVQLGVRGQALVQRPEVDRLDQVRPLTVGLLTAALVALLLPYVPSILGTLRGRTRPAGRLAFGEGD